MIHIKFYNTYYSYILLYVLITIQTIQTLLRQDQGGKDNDYPLAINIKTCKYLFYGYFPNLTSRYLSVER